MTFDLWGQSTRKIHDLIHLERAPFLCWGTYPLSSIQWELQTLNVSVCHQTLISVNTTSQVQLLSLIMRNKPLYILHTQFGRTTTKLWKINNISESRDIWKATSSLIEQVLIWVSSIWHLIFRMRLQSLTETQGFFNCLVDFYQLGWSQSTFLSTL